MGRKGCEMTDVTDMTPEQAERLRQNFKKLNKFMLSMWRLGLGSWLNFWPEYGGRIFVVSHTGRKSGLQRWTPLNYAIIDGDVYCTAGFGKIADWYLNVKKNPNVEVWLSGGLFKPDSWWEGVAEEVPQDDPIWLPYMREVMIGSGVVAPLMGIHPKKATDEELWKITGDYCLMRVRRKAPLTGEGGPGELAWVWPVAASVLAVALLLRPRRR
jgi:deazaflavin-dependent oxidoreductase (nitroreductase family)